MYVCMCVCACTYMSWPLKLAPATHTDKNTHTHTDTHTQTHTHTHSFTTQDSCIPRLADLWHAIRRPRDSVQSPPCVWMGGGVEGSSTNPLWRACGLHSELGLGSGWRLLSTWNGQSKLGWRGSSQGLCGRWSSSGLGRVWGLQSKLG